MEGRHCLSAATVISGLAGEVPSEAAAQESKFPPTALTSLHFEIDKLTCLFLLFSVPFIYINIFSISSDINCLIFMVQVRQRVSVENSSDKKDLKSQDVGLNTVSTSSRTPRSF